MKGESEKIWEFRRKTEKMKKNFPSCILLILLTATNIRIAYFCKHEFDNIHIK
jgi:hypothetical protein